MNLANIGEKRLLDIFLLFTPTDEIEEVATNLEAAGSAKFGVRWVPVTKGTVLRWVGLWFEMLASPRAGGRRSYWRTRTPWESNRGTMYSFAQFMPCHQFEMIYSLFTLPTYEHNDAQPDPFRYVRRWIDRCCACWQRALTPGDTLVVDESMFFWSGRGMPYWCVIPRKPRSTDCVRACGAP